MCASDSPDLWAHLWIFWRTKFALLGGDLGYAVSHLLTYPGWVREPMAFFDPLLPLMSVPLQFVFSLTATYNILVFIGLIFTAWSGFLLGRRISGSDGAGFLAGVITAFNPFMYRQLAAGYAEYAWWGVLPLAVLFYLDCAEEYNLRRAFFYGAALAFMLLMSVYCAACFAFFAFLDLVRQTVRAAAGRKNRLRNVLKGHGIALLISAPILFAWMWQLRQMEFKGMPWGRAFSAPEETAGLKQDGRERSPALKDEAAGFLARRVMQGSLDLNDLLLTAQPQFRRRAVGGPRREGEFSAERVFQMEWWLVLALAAAGIAAARERMRIAGWMGCAFLFLAVALGPYPVWSGRVLASLPLPYAWFYRFVPGFARLVVPGRAFFGSIMCLAVAAAVAWRACGTRLFPVGPRTMLPHVLAATALFVFFVLSGWADFSLPQSSAVLPELYADIAADGRRNAVLELPFSRGNIPLRMFAQTFHQKPVFRGLPAQEWTEEYDTRGIYGNVLLNALEYPPADAAPPPGIEAAARHLRELGFGWLVLHTDGYSDMTKFQIASRLIEEVFGEPWSVSPEGLVWRMD